MTDTTEAGGIAFGSGQDTELHRSAPLPLLYGIPEGEDMELDPASVYEREYEPYREEGDNRPRYIEEWSSTDASTWLMHTDWIIEHVVELSGEELGEGGHPQLEAAGKDPDVIAAFEAARALMASKITYLMANKKLRTLTVTWDEEGQPLLDGEPMYVKAP